MLKRMCKISWWKKNNLGRKKEFGVLLVWDSERRRAYDIADRVFTKILKESLIRHGAEE